MAGQEGLDATSQATGRINSREDIVLATLSGAFSKP
jgi:hypothetical protein